MSKNNNVNPGQYYVGGRLHPGDTTGLEAGRRQAFSASKQKEAGANTARKRAPAKRTKKAAGSKG